MVKDEVYENDPAVLIGFKIDLDHDDASAAPERVAVPTDVLHDLLHVARTVANGDGDVRGLEPREWTFRNLTLIGAQLDLYAQELIYEAFHADGGNPCEMRITDKGQEYLQLLGAKR